MDLSGGGGTDFTQVLDLIDATVNIEQRGESADLFLAICQRSDIHGPLYTAFDGRFVDTRCRPDAGTD